MSMGLNFWGFYNLGNSQEKSFDFPKITLLRKGAKKIAIKITFYSVFQNFRHRLSTRKPRKLERVLF